MGLAIHVITLGLVLFGFATGAVGQTFPALAVTVHTASGTPIPGATIRLQRADGFTLQGITGEDGTLSVSTLPTGKYQMSIVADAFQTSDLTISVVDLRQTIESDVTLVPEIRRTDTVDVVANDTGVATVAASPASAELRPAEMAPLPTIPTTVTDLLTLSPAVVHGQTNQLEIAGQGEQRSALLVNSNTATDPATGQFGTTIPVDSVESVTILQSPFLAEYGGFSAGVVSVQTKRGGEVWHFGLKEPIPDFRVRSGHIRGLRDATPRLSANGPILSEKLFYSQSLQYDLEKKQTRTLSFPNNESKDELLNAFTQFDYIHSTNHFFTGTLHLTPHHINFVNPQFFNPQPVTPSLRGNSYSLNVTEHAVVHGGLLDSSVTHESFRSDIGAQGGSAMILTPLGNTGNYFARRNRTSSRTEWREVLSASRGSAHAFKMGTVVALARTEGMFDFRPVQIQDSNRNLIEKIDFTPGTRYRNSDVQTAFFVQDHWSLNSRLSIDAGTRLEQQTTTSVLTLAPRIGAAWSPLSGDRLILRTGYGIFYDRVPLSVFSFNYRPEQTITSYDPVTGDVVAASHVSNILQTPANFAPSSQTWMVGMERPIRKFLRLQVNYRHTDSGGLILLTPQMDNGSSTRFLGSGGHAMYRQLETTGTMSWKRGQQLVLSYVHSKARGDLNTFDNYLGDFPDIPLRPNYYSNTPGDIPNRFIAWGVVNLPWKSRIAPIFEFHTGQPYALFDAFRNYVGTPYDDRTRYRDYVNFDERLSKDVRAVSKYSVRLSISVLNMFNHFNPLDVHANTADPLMGTFFGHYKRRYRADFELLF